MSNSSILAWKNPWTVESVGLKAHKDRKELDMIARMHLVTPASPAWRFSHSTTHDFGCNIVVILWELTVAK